MSLNPESSLNRDLLTEWHQLTLFIDQFSQLTVIHKRSCHSIDRGHPGSARLPAPNGDACTNHWSGTLHLRQLSRTMLLHSAAFFTVAPIRKSELEELDCRLLNDQYLQEYPTCRGT